MGRISILVHPGEAYIGLKKKDIHVFQKLPQPLTKGIKDVHKFAVSRVRYSGLSVCSHYL